LGKHGAGVKFFVGGATPFGGNFPLNLRLSQGCAQRCVGPQFVRGEKFSPGERIFLGEHLTAGGTSAFMGEDTISSRVCFGKG